MTPLLLSRGHPVYLRGALPLSCASLGVIKHDRGWELWRDTSGGNYCLCLRRLLGVSPPQGSTPFLVQRAFGCWGCREKCQADGLAPKESLLAPQICARRPLFPQCRDGGRLLESGILTNEACARGTRVIAPS